MSESHLPILEHRYLAWVSRSATSRYWLGCTVHIWTWSIHTPQQKYTRNTFHILLEGSKLFQKNWEIRNETRTLWISTPWVTSRTSSSRTNTLNTGSWAFWYRSRLWIAWSYRMKHIFDNKHVSSIWHKSSDVLRNLMNHLASFRYFIFPWSSEEQDNSHFTLNFSFWCHNLESTIMISSCEYLSTQGATVKNIGIIEPSLLCTTPFICYEKQHMASDCRELLWNCK